MTIKEAQDILIDEFEVFEEWEDRYRQIIKIGRDMRPLPEEFRLDKNKLDGCQSQVWIHAELKDGKMELYADSDAMIVKGLIGMLIRVYNGHTPDEILSNPPEFLTKLKIDNHLSPTRKNGLSAMLKQIQNYSIVFKAMGKS